MISDVKHVSYCGTEHPAAWQLNPFLEVKLDFLSYIFVNLFLRSYCFYFSSPIYPFKTPQIPPPPPPPTLLPWPTCARATFKGMQGWGNSLGFEAENLGIPELSMVKMMFAYFIQATTKKFLCSEGFYFRLNEQSWFVNFDSGQVMLKSKALITCVTFWLSNWFGFHHQHHCHFPIISFQLHFISIQSPCKALVSMLIFH